MYKTLKDLRLWKALVVTLSPALGIEKLDGTRQGNVLQFCVILRG